MSHYQLLEHTADMGIEATGADLGELFVAAARGLREIVFGDQTSAEREEEFPIELAAGDAEELLVVWLNELLFLMHDRGVFPTGFQLGDIDSLHLRGTVYGVSNSADLEPVREVKAVTFHRLNVVRREDHWHTRVYVDL
jgi:SHS2 domain-containing protein